MPSWWAGPRRKWRGTGRSQRLAAVSPAPRVAGLDRRYRRGIGFHGPVRLGLRRSELRYNIGRNCRAAELFRVMLAARGPDAGFAALNGQFAANRKAVLNVEAGAAEFPDPRRDFDAVAKFDRLEEIGAHIHQWDAPDAERARKFMRIDAERRLEHAPGA